VIDVAKAYTKGCIAAKSWDKKGGDCSNLFMQDERLKSSDIEIF
jgi:hypothetical protein